MKMRGTFADHALAQRLERAEAMAAARFVEARARSAPQAQAVWIERGGTYALYDGPESPVTQTFGLGLFEETSGETLDELEKFFGERGAPVYHEVSPLAGLGTAELLQARDYRLMEFTSVLYQTLEQLHAQDNPAGVSVKIADGEQAGTWAEVNARGWAPEQPELYDFLRNFGEMNRGRDDFVCFLVEHEGTPAAAGSLSMCNGVAMLAGAATIPGKRRLGLQQALLAARLQYAKQAGCDLAMMGAAPGSSSQRNAERNGFRIAYTRLKWKRAV